MRRRQFMACSGRAAFALSLLPIAGCAHKVALTSQSKRSAAERAVVTHLQKQLPAWMHESKVPGLSIALISDAKIAWRHGFGIKDRASQEPVDIETMFE